MLIKFHLCRDESDSEPQVKVRPGSDGRRHHKGGNGTRSDESSLKERIWDQVMSCHVMSEKVRSGKVR